MKMRSLVIMATILSMPVAAVQAGAWYGGEFSANISMVSNQDPNNKAMGKLYVGKNKVRAEGTVGSQTRIVILDTQNHKAWTLMPDKKEYHEGIAGPVPPKPDMDPLPDDADSMCNKGKGVTCQKVGMEALSGAQADKWELNMQGRDGKQTSMTIWADNKRHIILRQVTQNGPTTERRQTGVEMINGRDTERWEFTMAYQGKSQNFTQWVDSKLRIPVRMTGQQNAFTSEISGIQEGAQADELFTVPQGYRQVEPPRQENPPQQPQQPQQPAR
ncbi:MAG: hypothetical protein G8345_18535 [Magnetococcales bacterium]|nr:hypothetical protein [Magnetococcales bacterium]